MAKESKIDPVYEKLGERIRKYRAEKDLTQEQLGNLLDLSKQSISLIESGKQRLMMSDIPRLCKIFDVDAESFLKGVLY